MGVGGHHHAPAAFTPRKDPVHIVQEAGWASEPVWIGAENLASTGIRSPDFPARSESLYRLLHSIVIGSKISILWRRCTYYVWANKMRIKIRKTVLCHLESVIISFVCLLYVPCELHQEDWNIRKEAWAARTRVVLSSHLVCVKCITNYRERWLCNYVAQHVWEGEILIENLV